jgi:hypothetical protein
MRLQSITIGGQFKAIDFYQQQFETLAIEDQGDFARLFLGIPVIYRGGMDLGSPFMEFATEVEADNRIGKRAIVKTVGEDCLVVLHGSILYAEEELSGLSPMELPVDSNVHFIIVSAWFCWPTR